MRAGGSYFLLPTSYSLDPAPYSLLHTSYFLLPTPQVRARVMVDRDGDGKVEAHEVVVQAVENVKIRLQALVPAPRLQHNLDAEPVPVHSGGVHSPSAEPRAGRSPRKYQAGGRGRSGAPSSGVSKLC